MLCSLCQTKLSIKNIKRLCKVSSDHIVCSNCLNNHLKNQSSHPHFTCPTCDSIILYKNDKSDKSFELEKLILLLLSKK